MELPPILSSCLLIVEAKAREKNITVECNVAPDLPLLLGDGLRLKQILINLLGNAVKFTPDKGRVRVEAQALTPDHAAITVTDTGIGMSSDEIETACAPSARSTPASTSATRARGLGFPSPMRSPACMGANCASTPPRARARASASFFPLPARPPAPPSKLH